MHSVDSSGLRRAVLDASLTLRLDSGISLRDVPAGEVGGVDTWTIAVVAGALEKIDVAHIEVFCRRKTRLLQRPKGDGVKWV